MTEPNYYKALREFFKTEEIPFGRLSEIDVMHDDWCAMHQGEICNCNPTVRWTQAKDRVFRRYADGSPAEYVRPRRSNP